MYFARLQTGTVPACSEAKLHGAEMLALMYGCGSFLARSARPQSTEEIDDNELSYDRR
jgi:hypothetical protein